MSDKNDEKKNQEEMEELEKLLKAIEELEKETGKNGKRSPKRPKMISIEFGGVFHPNIYINFVFHLIMNVSLGYAIMELFSFTEYHNILYVLGVLGVYTLFETLFQSYFMLHHFQLVIKTFGTILYFVYLIMFYLIDQFIFVHSFNFINETLLVVFVAIFVMVRYVIAMTIRQQLRRHHWR